MLVGLERRDFLIMGIKREDTDRAEGRMGVAWGCQTLNWIYSDPATHSVTMERILDLLFCKQLVFLDS